MLNACMVLKGDRKLCYKLCCKHFATHALLQIGTENYSSCIMQKYNKICATYIFAKKDWKVLSRIALMSTPRSTK